MATEIIQIDIQDFISQTYEGDRYIFTFSI
jgi:hypothetical protein